MGKVLAVLEWRLDVRRMRNRSGVGWDIRWEGIRVVRTYFSWSVMKRSCVWVEIGIAIGIGIEVACFCYV